MVTKKGVSKQAQRTKLNEVYAKKLHTPAYYNLKPNRAIQNDHMGTIPKRR